MAEKGTDPQLSAKESFDDDIVCSTSLAHSSELDIFLTIKLIIRQKRHIASRIESSYFKHSDIPTQKKSQLGRRLVAILIPNLIVLLHSSQPRRNDFEFVG